MAEPTARERLLPYLLDRLTNDNPHSRQESLTSRTWSLRQSRQAVIRDLGWLLNATCRPAVDNLEEFPEVYKSVLNYGMPDLCGRTASGMSPQQLERMITQVIQRYEPRIMKGTLSVRVIDSGEVGAGAGGNPGPTSNVRPNAVVLEIRGEIWASPMPDQLYVKTEVDLESGQCMLQDKQYG
jgi:type VI secretion system protein ImpF